LLDFVNRVEERTPHDVELPAAELPIRAEKKVIFENLILVGIECSPRNKSEIGDEFFVLAAPVEVPFAPAGEAHGHLGHVFFFHDARAELLEAQAKDSSQDAVARIRSAPLAEEDTKAMTG